MRKTLGDAWRACGTGILAILKAFIMRKTRKVDQNTKHIRGRVYLNNGGKIIFPSSEETFLRALERKILESAKDFKHSGITLEFFELEIK